MKHHYHTARIPAFALAELLLAVAMVGIVIAIAAVALPDSRRRSMASGSVQNLGQIGSAARLFAADSNDAVFSFTWRAGSGHQCGSYTFPLATTDLQAAADQAICIIRERGNRPDITRISNWVPHVFYSHLALLDYLGEGLPSTWVVSPGDRKRLLWQQAVTAVPGDPNTAYFGSGCPLINSNEAKRWAYSSSYEMPPAWFSPDAMANGISTVSQNGVPTHRQYLVGDSLTPFGRRTLSEVRFPSQKVMMHESEDRFSGPRRAFFMYEEARVPVLLADGSAGVRSMNQANNGFDPSNPSSPNPTRVNYLPDHCLESPTLNGGQSEFVNGKIRWTQGGLRGRDFGGPEVPYPFP